VPRPAPGVGTGVALALSAGETLAALAVKATRRAFGPPRVFDRPLGQAVSLLPATACHRWVKLTGSQRSLESHVYETVRGFTPQLAT
jgi:hypothetical protein